MQRPRRGKCKVSAMPSSMVSEVESAGDSGEPCQGSQLQLDCPADFFLPELDRVSKKSLKKTDSCPICGNPFLDGTILLFLTTKILCSIPDIAIDKYPLVVRLPCHKDHVFDLECIAPWLKLHATCPMDRKNLLKKKEPLPQPVDDEEDGEYDDMFA